MRKLVLLAAASLLGIIVFLVSFLFALPYVTNLDGARMQIAAVASDLLHRPVTIGRLGIRAIPQPGLRIDDLVITERNGMPILDVDRIIIEVKVAPLLERHLQIERIVIDSPELNLTRNPDGSLNLPVPPAASGPSLPDALTRHGLPDMTLDLDEVRIEDASVTIRNKSGPRTPVVRAQGVDISFDEVVLKPLPPKAAGHAADSILTRMTADGDMKIREAVYKQTIKIERLKGDIAINAGIIRMDDVSFAMFGGKGGGEFAVNINKTPPRFESNLKMDALQMDQVAAGLGIAPAPVLGTASLEGVLVSRGLTPDEFMRGLAGIARFEIKDGVVRRMNALGKILTVLNFKRLFGGTLPDLAREGVPFDHLAGNMRFKNGVGTTDNLKLDSPVVDIDMKGSVSLPDRQVAMVASALGVDFEVHGPADNPDVSSRAMKGFKEGIGTLVDTGLGLFR